MKSLHLDSNIFSVYQPGTYHLQEEISETEDERDLLYKQQRSDMSYAYKGKLVARKNLPKSNKDYMPEGYFDSDTKMLLNLLSKNWVEALNQYLRTMYSGKKTLQITAHHKGSTSPKFYNFETDAATFVLFVQDKEWDKILSTVKKEHKQFDAFLQRAHGAYDGFSPFPPTSWETWQKMHKEEEDLDDSQRWRVYGRLMDWYLFGREHVSDKKDGDVLEANQTLFASLYAPCESDCIKNSLRFVAGKAVLFQR